MYKLFTIIILLFSGYSSTTMAQQCNSIPDGITKLFKSGNVVLFGEVHGTKEMPEHFFDVVCNANKTNKKIKIGIENSYKLTSILQQFINAKNLDDSINQLMKTKFWSKEYQSGRSSVDMLELLKSIRKLNLDSNNIEIFSFDHQGGGHQEGYREQLIVGSIFKHVDKNTLMLVLTGNIHSRITHGRPWDESAKNVGALLKEKYNATHSVYLKSSGGDGWICTPECKVQKLNGSPIDVNKIFVKSDGVNKHNWNWHIGEVSASLPARTLIKASK